MPGTQSKHHVSVPRPFASWMKKYSRRQQFRRMARSLLAEKDDVLTDLGYERRDLMSALNLPYDSDAIAYLQSHQLK